jgi:5-methylcytosine-specific restriction enzyme A
MSQRPATMKPNALRVRTASVVRLSKKTVERGYDANWKKLRALFIAENPICRHCDARNIITAATDVDHIVDIAKRPDLRLEWTNLQSLCKQCHGRKTRAEMNRSLNVGRQGAG